MQVNNKANILGCQVDRLTSAECVARIGELIQAGKPAHVITLNAEIAYQAQSNSQLQAIINAADLVTPDGIGIVWGGRQLGYDIKERVTGIDLLLTICRIAPLHKWKIFLLGSAPGVAAEAAQKLSADYPGLHIGGTRHGYFQEDDIPALINEIRQLKPQLLLVGLGAPKQEEWIRQYMQQLGGTVCIGVGGSFDVIAGRKKRAPAWMIQLNLEWLYRLVSEPSRWQRQLVLPKFAALILRAKSRSH